MQPPSGSWVGYAAALVAVTIWSGNFLIARAARNEVSPVSLAFWRWTIAVIVLAPFGARRLARHRLSVRTHLRYLSVTALLGVTTFNTLIYIAGHTTKALNLSLLAASSPIFVVVLSRFLAQEIISPRRWAGLGIASAGVLLLITRARWSTIASLSFSPGDLLMLGATVCFSLYTILVRHKPSDLPPVVFAFSTFSLGLLYLLPFYLLEISVGGKLRLEPATLASLLYVGVLASVVAFVSWNAAIRHIGPARCALIYYLVPLLSALGAGLLLHEGVDAHQLLNMALILGGVAVGSRR